MVSTGHQPNWWHFHRLPSTNDKAKALVGEQALNEGALVIADEQTNGRGQQNTTWHSQAGSSLTFSLVYFPRFLLAVYQFWLNMAVTVGIVQALRPHLDDAADQLAIKWPNDILIGRQKLGGVLIENMLTGSHLQCAIIGIGLNLNQSTEQLPVAEAISLLATTGKRYEAKDVASDLSTSIDQAYSQLKSGKWSALEQQYYQNLYGLYQWRSFRDQEGGRFRGYMQGVDEQGQLLVSDASGHQKAYALKAIAFED